MTFQQLAQFKVPSSKPEKVLQFRELEEVELALVGGGCGDVALA